MPHWLSEETGGKCPGLERPRALTDRLCRGGQLTWACVAPLATGGWGGPQGTEVTDATAKKPEHNHFEPHTIAAAVSLLSPPSRPKLKGKT